MGSPFSKMKRPRKNTPRNVYDTPDVQSNTPTGNLRSRPAAESPTERLGDENALQRRKQGNANVRLPRNVGKCNLHKIFYDSVIYSQVEHASILNVHSY